MNLSNFIAIHEIKAAVSNFNDTGKYDEKKEASRRSDAMFIGYYAENGPTYDPDGKYLCATCKFRVGTNKCATVEGKISFTTGSCRQWYIGPASKDSDIQKNRSSQKEVLYTERPNVKAFGCSRCEYGAKAKKQDAAGRPSWCDSWGMHIMPTACCERNEGKDDVHPNMIDAGGVGSGRRPGDLDKNERLKKESFGSLLERANFKDKGNGIYSSKKYGTITIQGKNWKHEIEHPDGKLHSVGNGESFTDLKNHLKWTGHIHAGGPGSGRHPWGRKEKEHVNLKNLSHQERVEFLKKYIQEHTIFGDKPKNTAKPQVSPAEKIYPHSGKGSMGVGKHPDNKPEERLGKITGPAGKPAVGLERKNAPAPFYRKSMDEADIAKEKAGQKEMSDWRSGRPNYKDWDPATKVSAGDEVKTLKTTRAFDNDKLEFKQFKPGTTLTVINVLPKVGNNPQLMVAQYPGRQGDIVHMPVTYVRLHRTLEGIQEKPAYKIRQEIGLEKGIRPGKIEQQVTTPGGATYTKLKPESAGRPQGSGNIWKQGQPNPSEHSLKGQFSTARGPKGNELKEVFTFDLKMKSFGQGTARATVWDANYKARTPTEVKNGTAGTTVIAWRDTKNKTGRVMEFDKDANGYIKQGSHPAQQFNNLGHMGSYLKQRYGVSMKLPGDSVVKRGRRK